VLFKIYKDVKIWQVWKMRELATLSFKIELLPHIFLGISLVIIAYAWFLESRKTKTNYLDEFSYQSYELSDENPKFDENPKPIFESLGLSFFETSLADLDEFRIWSETESKFYEYLPDRSDIGDEDFAQNLYESYREPIENNERISFTSKSKNGEILGYVDFYKNRRDVELGSLDISIFLSPFHQGQNLGSIILKSAVDYMFQLEDFKILHLLKLSVYPENVAAVMCYIKCGFLPSGAWNTDSFRVNDWEFQIKEYGINGLPILMTLSKERWSSIQTPESESKQNQEQFRLYLRACKNNGLTLPAKSGTNT
jgi:RimJ/RimL family protein N-acetyltransferase